MADTQPPANTSLDPAAVKAIFDRLGPTLDTFGARYPGEPSARQPAHTMYGGAHLFTATSAPKLGEVAHRFMEEYAGDPESLASAMGFDDAAFAATIHHRVLDKLDREPVEDFRLDFEDGYGNRPDAEEDACAVSAAGEVARGMEIDSLPPFIGIRIKPFSRDLFDRSTRTLDLFLTSLLERTRGLLPPVLLVTLPKVVDPHQVATLATLLDDLEQSHGLDRTVQIEVMVETTQSLVDFQGRCPLPAMVAAADGRCTGAHFGVYDYTASCGITAAYQGMRHPVCDSARHVMQQALSGTGVWLSDGATNILPVPPHRPDSDGALLSTEAMADNRRVVHTSWKVHFDDVRHSLRNGFYQGWDLHPAQLVSRYAALYSFFLEGYDSASARLRNFIDQAAQATLVGDVFDDAATGQALLNYFLRGLNCGAITEAEALATGLTLDELESKSFLKILQGRRA